MVEGYMKSAKLYWDFEMKYYKSTKQINDLCSDNPLPELTLHEKMSSIHAKKVDVKTEMKNQRATLKMNCQVGKSWHLNHTGVVLTALNLFLS